MGELLEYLWTRRTAAAMSVATTSLREIVELRLVFGGPSSKIPRRPRRRRKTGQPGRPRVFSAADEAAIRSLRRHPGFLRGLPPSVPRFKGPAAVETLAFYH